MTVTFADGTRIEVAATAYNDFVRHDLKWAEFVHGRANSAKVRLQWGRSNLLATSMAVMRATRMSILVRQAAANARILTAD